MKIVSKFHDYYDSLVHFGGIDNSKVYHRVTKTLEASMFPPQVKRPNDLYMMFDGGKLVSSSFHSSNNNVEIESFSVIFAGITYTGIRVINANKWPSLGEITYHYSYESLVKCLNDIDPTILPRRDKSLKEYFGCNKSEVARDWAINNKIVIASDCDCIGSRHASWVIDPQLSRVSFQKALDPYTAFQELEMWIGGVLTENKEIYQVANDIKIQQAGFDLKTSFRKPKQ